MTSKVNLRRLHTTVGELVVSIMDAALTVTGSKRDAYRLTSFVLNRMLQPAPVVCRSLVQTRMPRRYNA